MAEEGNEIRTICLLPFSGKESDWNWWLKQFLALSNVQGHKEALDCNLEVVNKTSTSKKKIQQAYNDLLLSCQDDISFGIIDKVDGNPFEAWKALKQKYKPLNTVTFSSSSPPPLRSSPTAAVPSSYFILSTPPP